MKLIILENYSQASEWAAKYIRNRIIQFNPGPSKYFTLGLPTGELQTRLRGYVVNATSVLIYCLKCSSSIWIFVHHITNKACQFLQGVDYYFLETWGAGFGARFVWGLLNFQALFSSQEPFLMLGKLALRVVGSSWSNHSLLPLLWISTHKSGRRKPFCLFFLPSGDPPEPYGYYLMSILQLKNFLEGRNDCWEIGRAKKFNIHQSFQLMDSTHWPV